MPFVELGRGGAHAVISVDDAETGGPPRLRRFAYRVRLATPWTHADVESLERHLAALRPVLGPQYVAPARPVQLSGHAVALALNAAMYGSRSNSSSRQPSFESASVDHVDSVDALDEWALEVPNLMGLWLSCPEGVDLRLGPHSGLPTVVAVEIKPKAAAALAARSLLAGLCLNRSNSHVCGDGSAGPSSHSDGNSGNGGYWFDSRHDVKFRASRFAMTQVHKARKRQPPEGCDPAPYGPVASIDERSRYEPADLFAATMETRSAVTAGEASEANAVSEAAAEEQQRCRERRVHAALAALLERPENNFRVFVRGQRLDWSSPDAATQAQAALEAALPEAAAQHTACAQPPSAEEAGGLIPLALPPEPPPPLTPLPATPLPAPPPALVWLAAVVARALLADGQQAAPTSVGSSGLCMGGGGALGALAAAQRRDVLDVEGAALLLQRLVQLRGFDDFAAARAEVDALLLVNGPLSEPKSEPEDAEEAEHAAPGDPGSSAAPPAHALPPPPCAADAAALQWPSDGKIIDGAKESGISNGSSRNSISRNGGISDGGSSDGGSSYGGNSNGSGSISSNVSRSNDNSSSISHGSSSHEDPRCLRGGVPSTALRAAALAHALALVDPARVAELLANWLLALAAADASLMLSFAAADVSRPSAGPPGHAEEEGPAAQALLPSETTAGFLPYLSNGQQRPAARGGGLVYCIGLTDVGPKPSSKIAAKAQEETDFCVLAAGTL